jgi:hypothetical protein
MHGPHTPYPDVGRTRLLTVVGLGVLAPVALVTAASYPTVAAALTGVLAVAVSGRAVVRSVADGPLRVRVPRTSLYVELCRDPTAGA